MRWLRRYTLTGKERLKVTANFSVKLKKLGKLLKPRAAEGW